MRTEQEIIALAISSANDETLKFGTSERGAFMYGFTAGYKKALEDNLKNLEDINKRIVLLKNSGSNSRKSENLLFKELETLLWVLSLFPSPPKP